MSQPVIPIDKPRYSLPVTGTHLFMLTKKVL